MVLLKYNARKSAQQGCISVVKVFFALIILAGTIAIFISIEDAGAGPAFLMLGVLIYVIYNFFVPKGRKLKVDVQVTEDSILLEKVKLPFASLHLDIYRDEEKFYRYHLWDEDGELAIYSIYEDKLLGTLSNSKIQVNTYKELSGRSAPSGIYVECQGERRFSYNLESGKYTISSKEGESITTKPNAFIVDPQFKLSQ